MAQSREDSLDFFLGLSAIGRGVIGQKIQNGYLASLYKNYKISSAAFQNTTNRDGNIHAAFTAGDIELILADVNEPGL